MIRILFYLSMVFVVVLLAAILWARSAPRPDDLGVHDGRLRPCPDTPNCVSSQQRDPEHGMEPVRYATSRSVARDHLLAILLLMPRTQITVDEPEYIAAEVRTWGFGFVDDVEFWFDPERLLIHFRSASRMAYTDFEVNRRRMQRIRSAFDALQRRGRQEHQEHLEQREPELQEQQQL